MKSLAIDEAGSTSHRSREMRKVKRFLKWVLGGFFIISGFTHLVLTGTQEQEMTARWPLALVYLSGVFEIFLGVLLFFRRLQVIAAWGMIAVLIAVSPAHIHMAINSDSDLVSWNRWGWLTWQFVLIGWAFWYTRVRHKRRVRSAGALTPARIDGPEAGAAALAFSGAGNAQLDVETGAANAAPELGADVSEAVADTGKKTQADKGRKKGQRAEDPGA